MSKNSNSRTAARKRKAAKDLLRWRNSPKGRLDADGASKPKQIERRIQWLAQVWKLPPCPKIGRTMTQGLLDYCEAHHVSLDWLLCGDLKGLKRMMQWRKMASVPAPATARERSIQRIKQMYGELTPEHQQIVDDEIRRLLAAREEEPA